MKLLVCFVFVCALLLVFTSGPANAWDGNRQGFIFGFGLGGGTTASYSNLYDEWDYLPGLSTTLKLGFAPSEHVMIHYWGQQLWIIYGATIAAPCLGVTYYKSETAPSMYYTMGAGPALLLNADVSNPGTSIFLAAGYEFHPHWSAELNLGYTSLEYGDEMFEVRMLVTILGY